MNRKETTKFLESLLIHDKFLSGKRYQRAPRASWNTYGISRERYKELRTLVRSGRYNTEAQIAADEANESIAEYILLSVTKNKSYDELRKRWELKEIERMPCGRTDFYGYRRLFYHLLDEGLKKDANRTN